MNVIDASAMLAVIYDEPGAEEVLDRLDHAVMSSVNYSEVLQKAVAAGQDVDTVASLLNRVLTGVIPFDARSAAETASLWSLTNRAGLSLADRACLALTAALNGVAVTADRAWADITIPNVMVHVIRR